MPICIMKIFLPVFIVVFWFFQTNAQSHFSGQVKGQLIDSLEKKPLMSASIVCNSVADSSTHYYSFSDKKGNFRIDSLPNGNYWLYISFVGYKTFRYSFNIVKDGESVDVGIIGLEKEWLSLRQFEVVETARPVRVKKDTLEYNADFFKVMENSMIDEVLKRIPGMQVDRNGGIMFNGEPIKSILVNGRPVFLDDPTLVSRNVFAELVDKIQIIDRNTDKSSSLSLTDSRREKVMNITIKESRKGQIVGQLIGGYGTNERFLVNSNINRFGTRQQLIFFGGGDNLSSTQLNEIGGPGVRSNLRSGINYSLDISKDATIGFDYVMDNGQITNGKSSIRHSFIGDSSLYYIQSSKTNEHSRNHSLNTRINYRIDSMSSLNINTKLNFYSVNNSLTSEYESLDRQQVLLNNGVVSSSNKGEAYTLSGNLTFDRKFSKINRSLSVVLDYSINNAIGKVNNFSDNMFSNSDGGKISDSINQQSFLKDDKREIMVSITYAEPVFRGHTLLLNYSQSNNLSPTSRSTFDYNVVSKLYDQISDSLSYSFRSTSANYMGSVAIRGQVERLDYSVYLNAITGFIRNLDRSYESIVLRPKGFIPQVYLNYSLTNSKRVRFSYLRNPQFPNVGQLQPVPDNVNPLYIQMGNPSLKPSYAHDFYLGFNYLDVSSLRGMSIYAMSRITQDKITNSSWIDTIGRQFFQPVNMNGSYTFHLSMDFSLPIGKKSDMFRSSSGVGMIRDINFINGIQGSSNNFSMSQSIKYNYSFREMVSLYVSGRVGYNKLNYSGNQGNNIVYYNYNLLFDGSTRLPGGILFGSGLNYALTSGRDVGYNTDIIIWNLFISKSIFHKQGALKVQVNDLLNRNMSVSNIVGENYIENVKEQVLGRYLLFSISYYIKKRSQQIRY